MRITREKIERRVRENVVHALMGTKYYHYIFRSYWHELVTRVKDNVDTSFFFFTAKPHPMAGIGHQISNWMAGYYYAQMFHVKYAHYPFMNAEWEDFFGFGKGETTIRELKQQGYRVRRIPMFNAQEPESILLIKRIMSSYSGKKIIFLTEQDQFLKNLPLVKDDIQHKFFSAEARKKDSVIYSKEHFNIAVHIRRGDILSDPSNPTLRMRYLSNDYFHQVLDAVLEHLHVDKSIHIYFFSQGKADDYPEFYKYENLHWCLDMGTRDSFLHFIYADLLITSKSSFSYKPALLNRTGIKVCPKNFWHDYPPRTQQDWLLAEDDGTIPLYELPKLSISKNNKA